MKQCIAIVEDDIDQQQNYADYLNSKHFETHCFSNVSEALAGISNVQPDLILLDVVLEDNPEGGFDICRQLLADNMDVPIIFLTDRTEEIDQIYGLRLGAWDYQTKPVSLMLLTERIKNVLRTHQARKGNKPASPSFVSSTNRKLSLDREKSYVAWQAQTVPLTLTEFRLFVAIMDAGAQGINYEALSESTMQRMVTNGTINSHVKNLRKKFLLIDPAFNAIRNKPGYGYRWEMP
jgi:two-component system OmpR family response regulator